MDKRFDWYSEINTDVLDAYIHQLLQYIDGNRSARGQNEAQLKETRLNQYKAAKQIITALYGCCFVIPRGSAKVSISLTASHYSISNTSTGAIKNYSYRSVKKVFDALKELNWIDYIPGNEVIGLTRIWSVNELSLSFVSIGLHWFAQIPKSQEELVILRNYANPDGVTKIEKGNKINLPISNLIATF